MNLEPGTLNLGLRTSDIEPRTFSTIPERDTIWRTARTLAGVLTGKTVTDLTSPLTPVALASRRLHIVGQQVVAVEPHGKHLLIYFSGGATLHTHQMMTGSWHVYRAGSPWRKPARFARVVLEAGGIVAVCFSAPLVELLPAPPVAATRHLGPDLLSSEFDLAEARRRLRGSPDREIGLVLLDQTVLAGIGNVYKSEVLFLCRVNRIDHVGDLPDEALDRLVATAARQMGRNLGPGMRWTRSDLSRERLWVYRRSGKPCFKCGQTILRFTQGEQARSTYWYPRCQKAEGRRQRCSPFGGLLCNS